MENNQYDFFIVGQGIAGTLLAYHLQKLNKKILVIDEGLAHTSSKTAAGIYNPIVFKRLVKSWRADELIPFLEIFYSEFETHFNCIILHKKNIVKLFSTQLEKDFWVKKQSAQQGLSFLTEVFNESYSEQIKDNGFGYAKVAHSGHVDVKKMLSVFRDSLIKNEALIEERLDCNDLTISTENIKWKGFSAKEIVFCEGYKSQNNPFLTMCKLKPVKGDVLTLNMPEFNCNEIINKNAFILPLGENQYKTGSTYNWEEIDETPKEKGFEEVVNKLQQITTTNYTLLQHEVGVRPSSFDRRPILGKHPKHPNIGVFNGLGTKGIMIGPFFAKQLAEHLVFNSEIDEEVDAKRFFK